MYVFRKVLLGAAIVSGALWLAACGAAVAPTATAPASPTAAPVASAPPTSATTGAASGVTIKLAQIQGFGLFLTDDANRTLYAFDNDKKDTSACTGGCLQTWPPFIVSNTPLAGDRINAALISTFARPDSGGMQAEYDSHPLYYYSGDKAPSDIKGHGIGGVWHVLSPRGSPMTNPAPASTKAP